MKTLKTTIRAAAVMAIAIGLASSASFAGDNEGSSWAQLVLPSLMIGPPISSPVIIAPPPTQRQRTGSLLTSCSRQGTCFAETGVSSATFSGTLQDNTAGGNDDAGAQVVSRRGRR